MVDEFCFRFDKRGDGAFPLFVFVVPRKGRAIAGDLFAVQRVAGVWCGEVIFWGRYFGGCPGDFPSRQVFCEVLAL